METAALIVAALVCGWAFNAGKQQGSRKGYYVGRKKGNQKRRFDKHRSKWT